MEAAQEFYQQLQRGYLDVMAKLQDGLTRLAEAHQGQAAEASQGAVSVFGNWVDQAPRWIHLTTSRTSSGDHRTGGSGAGGAGRAHRGRPGDGHVF